MFLSTVKRVSPRKEYFLPILLTHRRKNGRISLLRE
jgi:hypothetical protein